SAVGSRTGLRGEDQAVGGGGADGDSAGVGAVEARSAESQGDIGGDVVGKIGEGNQTRDRGQVGSPLERSAAGVARGADHGAAVIGAEVAELVLQADDRLLSESHTGGRASRGLGLNGYTAGRARHLAPQAKVGAGGPARHAGGAVAGEAAAGQRRAGRGTDPDILPGQLASNAAGTGAGHGEDQ